MIEFQKYVAAGNDFIVFESWDRTLNFTENQIKSLCDRRFGIGADGVLILSVHENYDFQMNYFNADGSRGEMCGNGARSLVHFAISKNRAGTKGTFWADDGSHQFIQAGELIDVEINVEGKLKSWDIPRKGCGFINTGVPHLIVPVEDVSIEDLIPMGERMNSHEAHPQGTNVNIIENSNGIVSIRTWERGVNTETLACGTGATAAAIYASEEWNFSWPIKLAFTGGDLEVDRRGNQYWLKGPAELVFEGHISLSSLQSN